MTFIDQIKETNLEIACYKLEAKVTNFQMKMDLKVDLDKEEF